MIIRPFLLTALLAFITTLLGTGWVWRNHAEAQIEKLREDRYQFSLGTLKAVAESGLELGAELDSLPGIQQLIADIRSRQRDIISIDVFDNRGRITTSSDRASLGSTLPNQWRDPCLNAGGVILRAQDDEALVQCTVLTNSFGQVAGGVALHYSPISAPIVRSGSQLPAVKNDMLSKLGSALPDSVAFALLAALGLFTAIAAYLGWYAARPVKRQLEQARRSLDQGDIQVSLPLIGPVAPALNELNKRADSLRRVDAEIDTIDQMGTS